VVQVTLLSKGRLMYHGERTGIVPWFQALGYSYSSDLHGLASDWVMDLVNVGFPGKAQMTEELGTTMLEEWQLQQASELFAQAVQQAVEEGALAEQDAVPMGKPGSEQAGVPSLDVDSGDEGSEAAGAGDQEEQKQHGRRGKRQVGVDVVVAEALDSKDGEQSEVLDTLQGAGWWKQFM
jgi:hypothetical protein